MPDGYIFGEGAFEELQNQNAWFNTNRQRIDEVINDGRGGRTNDYNKYSEFAQGILVTDLDPPDNPVGNKHPKVLRGTSSYICVMSQDKDGLLPYSQTGIGVKGNLFLKVYNFDRNSCWNAGDYILVGLIGDDWTPVGPPSSPATLFVLNEDLPAPSCLERPTWADGTIIEVDSSVNRGLDNPPAIKKTSRVSKFTRIDPTGFTWERGNFGMAIPWMGLKVITWMSCNTDGSDYDSCSSGAI